jgi:hypothetical protein
MENEVGWARGARERGRPHPPRLESHGWGLACDPNDAGPHTSLPAAIPRRRALVSPAEAVPTRSAARKPSVYPRAARLLPRTEVLVHERRREGVVPPAGGRDPAGSAATRPQPPPTAAALDDRVVGGSVAAAPTGLHTRSLRRGHPAWHDPEASPVRSAGDCGRSVDTLSSVRPRVGPGWGAWGVNGHRIRFSGGQKPTPGGRPRRAPSGRGDRRPHPGRVSPRPQPAPRGRGDRRPHPGRVSPRTQPAPRGRGGRRPHPGLVSPRASRHTARRASPLLHGRRRPSAS